LFRKITAPSGVNGTSSFFVSNVMLMKFSMSSARHGRRR